MPKNANRRTPPPHLPIGDGITDHRGQQHCRVCSLPVGHKVHEGWEASEETVAEERRRMGERE